MTIFKISKDKKRALNLIINAKDRFHEIIPLFPKYKVYKLIEEYYEIIVQLSTSLMYSEGFKSLDHVSLIEYLKKNCKEFNYVEISLMDDLRKLRNGIIYYGEESKKGFLENNEDKIQEIILKLFDLAEEKTKK